MDTRFSSIEEKLDRIDEVTHSLEFAHNEIALLMEENRSLKEELKEIKIHQSAMKKIVNELQTEVVDLKCRSMRKNVVFTNIPQDNKEEDVENVVKKFMTEKMQIVNADSLEIARAHRFGKSRKDKPRPIVVRFEKFKEKQLVTKNGKNLAGTKYGVNDQYPQEIMKKRSQLFPILRKAREKNLKAVMSVYKLFINNILFNPETEHILAERSDDGRRNENSE